MLLLLTITLADAKKPKVVPLPVNAWGHEVGMKADCFYPADFEKLQDGDRKMARQRALEEMKKQWSGKRKADEKVEDSEIDDAVTMEERVIDDIETVLLGRPVLIETIAKSNLDQCRAFMKGGDLEAWKGWLVPLSAKLTAGECMSPLIDTMFDYLEITTPWYRSVTVCSGDRIRISATVSDKYRITDKGEWITVAGTSEKATGADLPCNIEGCNIGMLVGRFTGDDGIVTTFGIGAAYEFRAPSNGQISWTINDTTWYDNKYFKSSTIEDRVAITVEPAK